MSKQGNKTIEQQSGWSIEEVTQWPVMASYHNQGWCVSEDKSTFDTYIDAGDFYVIKRAGDRGTRPYCLIHIKDERFTAKGSGNCEIDLGKLIGDAPVVIGGWLQDLVDAWDDIKRRSPMIQFNNAFDSLTDITRAINDLTRFNERQVIRINDRQRSFFSSTIPRSRHLEEIDVMEYPSPSTRPPLSMVDLRCRSTYPSIIQRAIDDAATEVRASIRPPSFKDQAKAKYNAFIERLKV